MKEKLKKLKVKRVERIKKSYELRVAGRSQAEIPSEAKAEAGRRVTRYWLRVPGRSEGEAGLPRIHTE